MSLPAAISLLKILVGIIFTMAAMIRNWKERRLVEQVTTLRHLPPGTWLPEPAHQRDREVLASLLRLPDEADPLTWLKQTRHEFTAHVLLWTALNHLRILVRGFRRAEQAGQELSANELELWLGMFSENTDFFEPLDAQPATVPEEQLRDLFRRLQERWQESPRDSIKRSRSTRFLVLLAALFRLPQSSDPLEWIQDHRPDLAASETLSYLLNQVRPPRSLVVEGEASKVQELNLRSRGKGITVKLGRFARRNSGLGLTLSARIAERRLNIPAGVQTLGLNWEGIERISDDLGHRYLVYERQEDHGKHLPFTYDLSLELECYPAISQPAREITLHSADTSFEIVNLGAGKYQPEVVNSIKLGDLSWRIKLSG